MSTESEIQAKKLALLSEKINKLKLASPYVPLPSRFPSTQKLFERVFSSHFCFLSGLQGRKRS